MKVQKRTDTCMGNALVGRRQQAREHELHRQRLAATISSIDTRPPPSQPHLTLYGRDYVTKKKATTEAAFSDLKMIQAIARTMTRSQSLPERMGPISLNAEARKNEIYRIMHDNHKLLDQIENVAPFASTKELLRTHHNSRRYLINASHAARTAGDYDSDINNFKDETRKLQDAQMESVSRRLERGRQQRKAREKVTLPALGNGGASSSKGLKGSSGGVGRKEGEATATATAAPQAKKGVSFISTGDEGGEKARPRISRTATPHPTKLPPMQEDNEEATEPAAEIAAEQAAATQMVEEAPLAQPDSPATEAPPTEALPAAEAPLTDAAPSAEPEVEAPQAIQEAAPAVEAEPKQEKDSDPEYGFEKDEEPAKQAPPAEADTEEAYQDDFADETVDNLDELTKEAAAQEDSFEASGADAAASTEDATS